MGKCEPGCQCLNCRKPAKNIMITMSARVVVEQVVTVKIGTPIHINNVPTGAQVLIVPTQILKNYQGHDSIECQVMVCHIPDVTVPSADMNEGPPRGVFN